MHDPCSGIWSPFRVCYHQHPQTIANDMIALFVLIRISPPHQTWLDRSCSSLASPPSPTSFYASCTSSSSICSMIVEASALPGAQSGKVNHLQEVVTGVVLLHFIPLHHHLTIVWRCTLDGFAHAGPPPCDIVHVPQMNLSCKYNHVHFSFYIFFSY